MIPSSEGEECITNISKSGKKLFARVPDEFLGQYGRGDKVKIILIEKAKPLTSEAINSVIEELLQKPNGDKLKGNIKGYSVEMPLSRILKHLGPEAAKSLLVETLQQ